MVAPKIDTEELVAVGTSIQVSKAVSQFRKVRVLAAKRFEQEAGPIYRMSFGHAQTKHFVIRVMPRAAIVDRSRDGVSLFYSGITRSALELVLFDILEQRIQEIIGRRHVRVDVDALCAIGASLGEETDTIRFDLNISASDAHAYPVRRAEADLYLSDPDLVYCASDVLH